MRKEIIQLREKMLRDGVDVVLIPTSDPHGSEYIHPRYEARQYFSGFTGDAGALVVTKDRAALWTDGRFFLQASEELAGSGIELMRSQQPGVPLMESFIADVLPEDGVLAFDGELVTAQYGALLRKSIAPRHGVIRCDYDPAEGIWADRPTIEPAPIWPLPVKYAGRSAAEKLAAVRAEMKKCGADYHLMASLDDIAWLFNLRGGDIPRNPVFFSWCLIDAENVRLFLFKGALSEEAKKELDAIGAEILPYDAIWEALRTLAHSTRVADGDVASVQKESQCKSLLVDYYAINYRLLETIPDSVRVIRGNNPARHMKHIKNEVEIEHIFESHHKDGAAMVKFLCWLDKEMTKSREMIRHGGKTSSSNTTTAESSAITELSASDRLERFRAEQQGFIDLSFDTIAGYAEHGAIIHYSATPESDATLRPEGFLLVDSGGQYLDGTTDITRTIALGPLTEEMRTHYTLVLKCNLALERAIFPAGTRGENLDVLARQYLWNLGLDYRHGPGHGVGFLLNVHEGPNGIRGRIIPGRLTCPLAPGMVTTDEPGYYFDGHYGIRIENELLCVPFKKTEYGAFYTFRNVTLCPYDRSAIRTDMLTPEELRQVNDYHAHVHKELAGRLTPEEEEWLKNATQPL